MEDDELGGFTQEPEERGLSLLSLWQLTRARLDVLQVMAGLLTSATVRDPLTWHNGESKKLFSEIDTPRNWKYESN